MERPQEPGEEAGPQGDPVMIASYAHVTLRKERERLAEYLR
jgi:hypothetical protein